MGYVNDERITELWAKIKGAFALKSEVPEDIRDYVDDALNKKVDKVAGQGLSEKNYTHAEQEKLAGIEPGANKTVVDAAMSTTSTNPLQNKVITDKTVVIDGLLEQLESQKASLTQLTQTLTEAKNYADGTYQQATGYTDSKIAELIGGAPTTLDTLKEIADAIQSNQSIVEGINAAIGSKADAVELDTHIENTTIHVTSSEKAGWTAKLDKTGDASNVTNTFTAATTLATLTSKEKLSVSLGKVAKAISTLISHISTAASANALGHVKVDAAMSTTSTNPLQNKAVTTEVEKIKKEVEECFTSVSEGKATIASALTDNGVPTDAEAMFEVMAQQVGEVRSGGNAAAGDLLLGKSAYSGRKLIIGTRADYRGDWRVYDSGEFSIAEVFHTAAKADTNYVENATWQALSSATIDFSFMHEHNLNLELYKPDNEEDVRWFVAGHIWTENPYGFRCGRGYAADGTSAQYFYFEDILFGNGEFKNVHLPVHNIDGNLTFDEKISSVRCFNSVFSTVSPSSGSYNPLSVKAEVFGDYVHMAMSGKNLYATRGTLEQIKARYRIFYKA